MLAVSVCAVHGMPLQHPGSHLIDQRAQVRPHIGHLLDLLEHRQDVQQLPATRDHVSEPSATQACRKLLNGQVPTLMPSCNSCRSASITGGKRVVA